MNYLKREPPPTHPLMDSTGFDSEGNDSMTNSESKAGGTGSPSHHHKETSTKKTLLKDLSKRILRRVNSGNFSHSHRNQQRQEHKKSIAQLKPFLPGTNSKSRKGSTSALQQSGVSAVLTEVSTCTPETTTATSGGGGGQIKMLPVKDLAVHRSSISSIGPPMIELSEYGHVIGGPKERVERQTRSNTNSIDRNSHFRENCSGNDSNSFIIANHGMKGTFHIAPENSLHLFYFQLSLFTFFLRFTMEYQRIREEANQLAHVYDFGRERVKLSHSKRHLDTFVVSTSAWRYNKIRRCSIVRISRPAANNSSCATTK